MKRKLLLTLMVGITLLSSCTRERIDAPEGKNSGPGDITLTLAAPGNFQGGLTKAQLPQADENTIQSATIIVFNTSGVYQYHKTSTKINPVTDKINVTVNLRTDGAAYDLLVLTNLSGYFSDAQIESALAGVTLDNAYQKLQMTALASSGWGQDKFVMAGVVKNYTLSSSVSEIGTVNLVRSLASVDVGLDWQGGDVWQGLDNFELEEVFVYNANSEYTLLPKAAAWEDATCSRVNAPTIYKFGTGDNVATSLGNTSASALRYWSDNITVAGAALNNAGNGQNITSRMYIAEVQNDETTSAENRPAVIIKGKYNGTSYYYKMEFASLNSNGTIASYLNILRNHKYRFNIRAIQGPGYGTPDEAFNSQAMNIINNVVVWDENMQDVVFNGQYYIAFEKRTVYFDQFANPDSYTLRIESNVPGDLKLSNASALLKADRDGSWTETVAGKKWTYSTDSHFTAELKYISTDGEKKFYDLTVTGKPTQSPDKERQSILTITAANFMGSVTIRQDEHLDFRLITLPNSENALMVGGAAQRIPIEVSSTHDYMFAYTTGAMIEGVYTQESGGAVLTPNVSIIPASTKKVWIAVTSWESVDPRVASVEFRHKDGIGSDAPAVNYNILQVKPMLTATIAGGISGTVPKTGGTVNIDVNSNLTKWLPKMWINGVAVAAAEIGTYLDRTQGSGKMVVKFTAPVLTGTEDNIYEFQFYNDDIAVSSLKLKVSQRAYTLEFDPIADKTEVLASDEVYPNAGLIDFMAMTDIRFGVKIYEGNDNTGREIMNKPPVGAVPTSVKSVRYRILLYSPIYTSELYSQLWSLTDDITLSVYFYPEGLEDDMSSHVFAKTLTMKKMIPGSGDILYTDETGVLKVGKWTEINDMTKLLYFKEGSIVGVTGNSAAWSASEVKYNVTGANYTTYANINNSHTYNSHVYSNMTIYDLHSSDRAKVGLGDPCRLIGLTAAQVRTRANNNTIEDYDSGWRTPSGMENMAFIGGTMNNYAAGSGGMTLKNLDMRYWGAGPSGSLFNGAWFPIPGDAEATTGRTIINTDPNGFLPAAGYRDAAGVMTQKGTEGFYRIGTYYSSNFQVLRFTSAYVYPKENIAITGRAMPVRCVRK